MSIETSASSGAEFEDIPASLEEIRDEISEVEESLLNSLLSVEQLNQHQNSLKDISIQLRDGLSDEKLNALFFEAQSLRAKINHEIQLEKMKLVNMENALRFDIESLEMTINSILQNIVSTDVRSSLSQYLVDLKKHKEVIENNSAFNNRTKSQEIRAEVDKIFDDVYKIKNKS